MPTGIYPHKKGRFVSDETRKKMSLAHKGKIISEKQRREHSEFLKRTNFKPPSFLGRHHTEETKQKIRKHHLGTKASIVTKNKLSERQLGEKNINYGKNFSIEHRKKIGRKGCLNKNWRGGITKDNARIRNSFEYKLWREAVFKRDKYTCVLCKIKNGKGKTIILNADHIKQFAYYPELRFKLSNGRTLCVKCHKKTPTFKRKIKKNE